MTPSPKISILVISLVALSGIATSSLATIFSKTGLPTEPDGLVDGRWNLKDIQELRVSISPEQEQQLMACIGETICTRGNERFKCSASVVGKTDIILTARHCVKGAHHIGETEGPTDLVDKCTFSNFLDRNKNINVTIPAKYTEGWLLNNDDFAVLRLKDSVRACHPFSVDKSGSLMKPWGSFLNVTGAQRGTLNHLADDQPIVAKGEIKVVRENPLEGPSFYESDVDLDHGGSGSGVFVVADGTLVSDETGSLVFKGIAIANSNEPKDGEPYRPGENGNATFIVALDDGFLIDLRTELESFRKDQ